MMVAVVRYGPGTRVTEQFQTGNYHVYVIPAPVTREFALT